MRTAWGAAATWLHPRKSGMLMLAAIAAAGVLAACGGSSDTGGSGENGSSAASSGGKSSAQLALVGYSTPKKAYDALTSAFQKTSAGEGVTFTQSFGASGAQSRAVASGQP